MIKGTRWEGTCLPKAGTRSDVCGIWEDGVWGTSQSCSTLKRL